MERDVADAPRVRDACDGALRQHLARDLAAALGRWCDRDDPSVWLVRSLALELGVGADWKSDQFASAVTAGVARALAATLTGDGDGANAIRFPDRPAYLARFLADAATGDAWSRWYYAGFDGLRALPTSAAIRTATLADPQLGLEAMRRLSDPELARVVGTLSAPDRDRVLERFAAVTAVGEPARSVSRAWSAWEQHADTFADANARALALFVRAAQSDCGGPPVLAAIKAIDTAHEAVSNLDAAGFRRVLSWLDSDDSLDAAAVPPALRAVPRELLARIVGSRKIASAPATDLSEPAPTPFGGVFFFLPQLDALPLEEWLASWPEPEGASAPAALRLLIAAKCAGGERFAAAFADAVLRRLLRVGSELTPDSARTWLRLAGPERRRALARAAKDAAQAERVDVRMRGEERLRLALPGDAGMGRDWDSVLGTIAQLVLRTFARRLPGFSGSRFTHLHRNFLDVSATLEEEPGRLIARVARPPLYLVLNLTGITRASYSIRGEPRPIAVFAQD